MSYVFISYIYIYIYIYVYIHTHLHAYNKYKINVKKINAWEYIFGLFKKNIHFVFI